VALDCRFENALLHSGAVLRASAATQSFVPLNLFCLCSVFCRTGRSILRSFTLSNCTAEAQNTTLAGGR